LHELRSAAVALERRLQSFVAAASDASPSLLAETITASSDKRGLPVGCGTSDSTHSNGDEIGNDPNRSGRAV
jgi:hypothetical protein